FGLSGVQRQTAGRRTASGGRRRKAVSGVFVLSDGVGVQTDFVSALRRGRLSEATPLFGGGSCRRSGRSLRYLQVLSEIGGHDSGRPRHTAGGRNRNRGPGPLGCRARV